MDYHVAERDFCVPLNKRTCKAFTTMGKYFGKEHERNFFYNKNRTRSNFINRWDYLWMERNII